MIAIQYDTRNIVNSSVQLGDSLRLVLSSIGNIPMQDEYKVHVPVRELLAKQEVALMESIGQHSRLWATSDGPSRMKPTTYHDGSFCISGDIFLQRVLEKADAVLKSSTISSIVGANWSEVVNRYGTVSGQDRIHPKTALLTFGGIFEFYKNEQGVVDFGHFTSLKDLATNCSMSFGRGVLNFHTQARAPTKPHKFRDQAAARSDSGKLAALEMQVQEQAKQIAELQAMVQTLMLRK